MINIIIMGIILGILTSAYTFNLHKLKINNNRNQFIKKYLFAIAITSILTAIITFLYNRYGLTNQFISMAFIAWLLISISVYDIRNHEVPIDAIILGCIIGILMVLLNPNLIWQDALIGCIGIGGSLAIISRLTRGALGIGDAFVIGAVGLVMGYKMALAILLYGLVLSGLIGLILLTFHKVNRKTKLPLVPFLLAAYILLMVV